MMELLDQDTIDEALKGPGLAGGLADPGFESDMMSDDHSMPSHQIGLPDGVLWVLTWTLPINLEISDDDILPVSVQDEEGGNKN